MTAPLASRRSFITGLVSLVAATLAACDPPRKCLLSHHEWQYPYLAFSGSADPTMRALAFVPQDAVVCDKYEDLR